MVESCLVSKEFILDKDELIFSYLLKCISVKEPYKKEDGFNTRALNLLIDIDYNKLNSTYSYVFVPIEKSFLNKDILELFNKEKIIFHIFDLIEIDKAFIDSLSSFKKEGFKFSFKFHPAFYFEEKYLGMFDYVFVSKNNIDKILNSFKREIIIITDLNTREEFNSLKESFYLFMGDFYKEKNIIVVKSITTNFIEVLNLYNAISKEESIDYIEKLLKKNPDILTKLLALLNSSFFSLRKKVSSIREAIVLLGYKKLSSFVLFLLFTKSGPPNKNPAFIETLLKATVCELLAKELFNSKELSDKAFLMGIVYGVYSYLGLDKEEFLESLGITDDIKIAVSEEKGDLGKILKAANFIEKDDIKGFLDTLREIKENIDDDYIIKKIKEIYL